MNSKASSGSQATSCPMPVRHKPFTAKPLLRRAAAGPRGSHTASAQDDESSSGKPADDNNLPPWLRKEQLEKLRDPNESSIPFAVFLVGSVLVAIATVGSIFELINQNPIFGVIQPGNLLYTPILGFFSLTGLPTAGFLFLKGVQGANAMSERMDKVDGR